MDKRTNIPDVFTEYYFIVMNKSGEIIYSKTLPAKEFNKLVKDLTITASSP